MDSVTITGIEEVKRRLSGITNPGTRRKILRKTAQLIVKNSKARITAQTDLTGQAWAPRSRKAPANLQNKKMERGLKKRLTVVFSNDTKAVIGFKTAQEKRVALSQQIGYTKTVSNNSRANRTKSAAATMAQAKKLLSLGYRIPRSRKRPTIAWIRSKMTQGQAGLIIRILEGRAPKTSYTVTLPPRSFLGISQSDLAQINQIFTDEINNSLR